MADYPEVAGFCPMGCGHTLFLGEGGYVTCSYGRCPDPDAASAILGERETHHVVQLGEYGFDVLHPIRERLDGKLLGCPVAAWIGAQAPADLPPRGRYRVREPAGDTVWEPLS
jgi:hypothetical protein